MSSLVSSLSVWLVPLLVTVLPLYAYVRGVPVYDAFVEGASEGLEMVWRIFPYLIAIFLAVNIFRSSGALDSLVGVLHPVLSRIGMPGEVVPLALIRPLSGNASLGILADILRKSGPDTLAGHLASTLQGASDTTFYVLTLYYGAVRIRHQRWSLWVGLFGDAVGLTAALIMTHVFFH